MWRCGVRDGGDWGGMQAGRGDGCVIRPWKGGGEEETRDGMDGLLLLSPLYLITAMVPINAGNRCRSGTPSCRSPSLFCV